MMPHNKSWKFQHSFQLPSFALHARMNSQKTLISILVQDFLSGLDYEKNFDEASIGKEVSRKMDLSDLYYAIEDAKIPTDYRFGEKAATSSPEWFLTVGSSGIVKVTRETKNLVGDVVENSSELRLNKVSEKHKIQQLQNQVLTLREQMRQSIAKMNEQIKANEEKIGFLTHSLNHKNKEQKKMGEIGALQKEQNEIEKSIDVIKQTVSDLKAEHMREVSAFTQTLREEMNAKMKQRYDSDLETLNARLKIYDEKIDSQQEEVAKSIKLLKEHSEQTKGDLKKKSSKYINLEDQNLRLLQEKHKQYSKKLSSHISHSEMMWQIMSKEITEVKSSFEIFVDNMLEKEKSPFCIQSKEGKNENKIKKETSKKRKETESIEIRDKKELFQLQLKFGECKGRQNFQIVNNITTYICEESINSQLLGRKVITEKQTSFFFRILEDQNKFLGFGIIDQSYGDQRQNSTQNESRPNIICFYRNGRLRGEGRGEISKFQTSRGFSKGQTIQVKVNLLRGVISWHNSRVCLLEHPSSFLFNRSIKWVPYIYCTFKGQQVQWIDELDRQYL